MTCKHDGKSEVIEVRRTDDGTRRRRLCLECNARFTTLEAVVTGQRKPQPSAAPEQRDFALAGWLR